MTRLRVMHNEPPPSLDAGAEAAHQTREAEKRLMLPESAYLRMPWPDVDALVGGIAPGDVWFTGAFSGNGKTTFLLNLVKLIVEDSRRVYYVGTETRPNLIRTQLACLRLGIYAGDVLSGQATSWSDWHEVRARLVEEVRAICTSDAFLVAPVERVDVAALVGAYRDAALQGCDLLIIDHIDHVDEAQGRGAFDVSRQVIARTLDLAQSTGVRTIAATQFNNEGLRGDRLGIHAPPQPHHVYMGGHKRQIAWGMLGLYRPMREGLTKDELKAARAGLLKPSEYLEVDTMAVSVMKHRNYGSREGQTCRLRFDHGRLLDVPEKDKYSTTYDGQRRI